MTKGSGKSILMVLIAKWLMEHDPVARILIVTDRDDLDKQIDRVMNTAGGVGEDAPNRASPRGGSSWVSWARAVPRLLYALINKFDPADLSGPPPPVHGRFYVVR